MSVSTSVSVSRMGAASSVICSGDASSTTAPYEASIAALPGPIVLACQSGYSVSIISSIKEYRMKYG